MDYRLQLSHFKRWLSLLPLALGFAFAANAETVEIDGLYYELDNEGFTATLTYENTTTSNYSSLQADVVVPSSVTYNGISYSVTTIANKAFANCSSLESISIPATVTQIGTAAWEQSSSVDPITLPFYNCTSLKNVRFEDGEKDIALGCYNYSTASNYYSYNKGLFASCPLEDVYIGRNITYVSNSSYSSSNYPYYYGYSAFYNQSKLTKVTIGNNVTEIPAYLFYKCTNLSVMEFGNSLTSIPK